MSRFDVFDSDGAMPIDLWLHNAELAINGKRGQQALRDLIIALDALPEHKLIAGDLIETSIDDDDNRVYGGVCAVGAYALHKGRTPEQLRLDNTYYGYDGGDCWSTAEAGKAAGLTYTLAWEIARLNDDTLEGVSEEERWQKVRDWALEHIHA